MGQEELSELERIIAEAMGISITEAKTIKARIQKETIASASLTAEELAACRVLGINPLTYQRRREANAGIKENQPAPDVSTYSDKMIPEGREQNPAVIQTLAKYENAGKNHISRQ